MILVKQIHYLPIPGTVTMSDTTNFSALLPQNLESIIAGWLHDDMPSFDVGGIVVGS